MVSTITRTLDGFRWIVLNTETPVFVLTLVRVRPERSIRLNVFRYGLNIAAGIMSHEKMVLHAVVCESYVHDYYPLKNCAL
jgi:hypothetical protein